MHLEPGNWVLFLAPFTLTGCATLGKSLGLSELSFPTVTSTCLGLRLHYYAVGDIICQLPPTYVIPQLTSLTVLVKLVFLVMEAHYLKPTHIGPASGASEQAGPITTVL